MSGGSRLYVLVGYSDQVMLQVLSALSQMRERIFLLDSNARSGSTMPGSAMARKTRRMAPGSNGPEVTADHVLHVPAVAASEHASMLLRRLVCPSAFLMAWRSAGSGERSGASPVRSP